MGVSYSFRGDRLLNRVEKRVVQDRVRLSKDLRDMIKMANSNRCCYCGDKFDGGTIDHFIPIARGGSNNHDNLLPACAVCNEAKGSQVWDTSCLADNVDSLFRDVAQVRIDDFVEYSHGLNHFRALVCDRYLFDIAPLVFVFPNGRKAASKGAKRKGYKVAFERCQLKPEFSLVGAFQTALEKLHMCDHPEDVPENYEFLCLFTDFFAVTVDGRLVGFFVLHPSWDEAAQQRVFKVNWYTLTASVTGLQGLSCLDDTLIWTLLHELGGFDYIGFESGANAGVDGLFKQWEYQFTHDPSEASGFIGITLADFNYDEHPDVFKVGGTQFLENYWVSGECEAWCRKHKNVAWMKDAFCSVSPNVGK